MRALWVAMLSVTTAATGAANELERSVAAMAEVGAAWSPSFSPDGKQLAFVSDLTGIPQVWVADVRGGWPKAVTRLEDQVSSVTWSPDGEWLAFQLAPAGGMNSQVYLVRPAGTDLLRLTDGGKENNWLGDWSHDGSLLTLASNRDSLRGMDSFTYDLASGSLAKIASNPGIGRISDLSRDGRLAAIWRMRSRGDADVYLRSLETGDESLLTPHEGPATYGGGRFSPDGRTVYLASNTGRDRVAFSRVRLSAAGTPGAEEVVAGRDDADLQSFTITDDGRVAALVWNVAGRNELMFLDLQTLSGARSKPLPAELIGGLTFSRDGRIIAMTLSGSRAPSDIWIQERGELRQLTFSAHVGVDLGRLLAPELVTYPAHDGLELSGWLYRPAGTAAPGPYVLSFHGGPEGQERPRFRAVYQALLARGIGVFAPNVRGSSGFGKRFVNLDNGELRRDGISDIEASARYLVDNGIADARRLGIMGGSYGGYMTMAGLAWYPDLFAAGANLFGVVNFETFFEHTEPWMAAISTVEYGDPATEGQMLRELSPIHKVDEVKAPTIVLHGANDTNVPVVEAEQVVDNLKRRGVPVEYVLFEDEGHGFRKAKNRITSSVAIVRWFEKYLKAPQPGE